MSDNMSAKQQHPYHLVELSYWPILTAFSLFLLTLGTVMFLHEHSFGEIVAIVGVLSVIYCSFGWWKDVINEGRIGKHHTEAVRTGLRIGMSLFIISEVMFFSHSFFRIFQQAFFLLEF